jgi:ribosomal protein L16 Arg81 hydroxylase
MDRTVPIFLLPFSSETFRSEYLGKAILEIQRYDAQYFSKVLSLSEIDELVTSVRIPATNLNLARGDTPLPAEQYCIGGAYVDKRRMLDLHKAGATIILRSMEQWSPQLNRLRVAAESFFHVDCQINVYVTPAGEKSTPPHWDTHDLVVLQIAGNKKWRLYDGQRTLPLGDERFRIGEDYVSPHYREIVLQQGDTLYLPRGVIHEPIADTYSVHLSIGVNILRWYDVFSTALRLLAAEQGCPLRTHVPIVDNFAASKCPVDFASRLADSDVLGRALDVLREDLQGRRAVDLQGVMLNIARDFQGSSLVCLAGCDSTDKINYSGRERV